MQITKKTLTVTVVAVLSFGMLAGFLVAQNPTLTARAHESGEEVDQQTLEDLYEAVFGRPLDEGALSHLGKNLKQILSDFNRSGEKRYYSTLFQAVKTYEEAIRAPGDLSAEDKQRYLDLIDAALADLLAWVATLPEQDICKGIVGPERAREVIKGNYERLEARGKDAFGLHNAYDRGKLDKLSLPNRRCVTPSPTPTPTPTPGSITVIKTVTGDSVASWSFGFTGSWAFNLASGSASILKPSLASGSYTVKENISSLPTGWSFVGISCPGATVTASGSLATITLGTGQNVSCTFTNNYDSTP